MIQPGSYPKVQVGPHVFEEATNHGSQVDDMGRLVFLENSQRLLEVPKLENTHTDIKVVFVLKQVICQTELDFVCVIKTGEHSHEVGILGGEEDPLLCLLNSFFLIDDALYSPAHQACASSHQHPHRALLLF